MENRPIAGSHLTDTQVASAVRMLMRDQLDHEAVCLVARDRIVSLSTERDQLKARLEAAEREREELRRWRELHKDNTDCPDCNGTAIGCETCTESGLVGIYQRDAKQRREGAAEWLLEIANNRFSDGLFIPDRTHYTAAEVREILEQAAQRLREGGE